MGRTPASQRIDEQRFVEGFIERHGGKILRVARRYAGSGQDADDAYQHSLEKLLTKAPKDAGEEQLLGWVLTVVRNEALLQHRFYRRFDPDGLDSHAPRLTATGDLPEQAALNSERMRQGREAVQHLSADELRCLLLRADDLSYAEICDVTGFSLSKVNRLLTAGRKRFDERIDRIVGGSECRRIASSLSMIADGEASREISESCRSHLENCLHCQATLRAYRSAPRSVSELFPLSFLLSERADGLVHDVGRTLRAAADSVSSAISSLAARVMPNPVAFQAVAESSVAKKFALATVVSTALMVGGTGVHKVALGDRIGPAVDGAARTQFVNAEAGFSPAPRGATSSQQVDARTRAVDRRPRTARQSDVVGEDPGVSPGAADGATETLVGNSSEDNDAFDSSRDSFLESGDGVDPAADPANSLVP